MQAPGALRLTGALRGQARRHAARRHWALLPGPDRRGGAHTLAPCDPPSLVLVASLRWILGTGVFAGLWDAQFEGLYAERTNFLASFAP